MVSCDFFGPRQGPTKTAGAVPEIYDRRKQGHTSAAMRLHFSAGLPDMCSLRLLARRGSMRYIKKDRLRYQSVSVPPLFATTSDARAVAGAFSAIRKLFARVLYAHIAWACSGIPHPISKELRTDRGGVPQSAIHTRYHAVQGGGIPPPRPTLIRTSLPLYDRITIHTDSQYEPVGMRYKIYDVHMRTIHE
ncbi:hypothetical protein AcV5_007217 [Taiwanofungus camphoratus]|nr:hypothetical protein AcV5_007217 [Antrodia cinnamomea]KAI0958537.1 hypothetical protein AcV7_004331 [Antrodia cinnamomea]